MRSRTLRSREPSLWRSSVALAADDEPWNLEQLARQHALAHTHWWLVETKRLAAEKLRARFPSRARVLDAGTGAGTLAAILGEGFDVVATDLSSAALALARREGLARLVRSTVDDLPFARAAFDAVVSLDVLYHEAVRDERGALREVARVLRPGGVLVLNLPAYRWMMSAHDGIARSARRYTREQVRDLLRDAGLVPRQITYWNCLLFPLAVLTRKVLCRSGSDIAPMNPVLNRVLATILRAEAFWLRRANLPFGLSVFALAERRS